MTLKRFTVRISYCDYIVYDILYGLNVMVHVIRKVEVEKKGSIYVACGTGSM